MLNQDAANLMRRDGGGYCRAKHSLPWVSGFTLILKDIHNIHAYIHVLSKKRKGDCISKIIFIKSK